MKILFITPRFPYPLIKGDKLRAYYQIKHLSKRNEIILLSFVEKEEEKFIPEIKKYCYRIETVTLNHISSYLQMIFHFFSHIPFQVSYYKSLKMQKKIDVILEEEKPDIIHVQLIRIAPYLLDFNKVPKVVDMIDTLSLNMKYRFKYEKIFLKLLFFIEWKKTKKYEKEIYTRFNTTIVVSQIDKDAIDPNYNNIVVNSNGVDVNYFSFVPFENREPDTLIFLGNMNYFPNIDAVSFFLKKIYPIIKKENPEVKFIICGTNPKSSILMLSASDKSIIVTGFIEDIRVYLNKSTILVCPIRCGSGIQNKILEAMSVGLPVITTEQVVNAINAKPYEEIIVSSEDPNEFANKTLQLLRDRSFQKKLSINGRRLMEKEYNWERSVKDLEQIYEKAINRDEAIRC